MSEYRFTQDWFHWAIPSWTEITKMLKNRHNFLEIGSYEGRSTVWTVENMMEEDSEIIAVDTWEGGEEHAFVGEKMSVVERNFDHNCELVCEKFPRRHVTKWKATSDFALASLIVEKRKFDFIYIDGSHIAKDVLTDACMAFRLLDVGGIMVFDDYMWGNPRDILHRPKMAIDTFTTMYAEHLEVVAMGSQVAVRKK